MRILIVNTDYQGYLDSLYGQRPDLASASYGRQLEARIQGLFGAADYYSHGFRAHGAEAWEIHANNLPMQLAWAGEQGFSPTRPGILSRLGRRLRRRWVGKELDQPLRAILARQLAHYRPDVVLNQDMYQIDGRFLKAHAGSRALVVGQIASPLPGMVRLTNYDLIVSSLPNLVEAFRQRGLRSELNRLAFDPRVHSMVPPQPTRHGVVFVGSLGQAHRRRSMLLEHLSRSCENFEIWGPGVDVLPSDSPIRACHRGEAWGIDMYRHFARAAIVINVHIDVAEGHANNLRLFEATGMGALLLTDAQMDLSTLFEPGREVVTYTSPDDCLQAVTQLSADESRRSNIARAGQQRTLEAHNYTRRMGELLAIFERYRKLVT